MTRTIDYGHDFDRLQNAYRRVQDVIEDIALLKQTKVKSSHKNQLLTLKKDESERLIGRLKRVTSYHDDLRLHNCTLYKNNSPLRNSASVTPDLV